MSSDSASTRKVHEHEHQQHWHTMVAPGSPSVVARPRTICMCVDKSLHSERAWEHCLKHFVNSTDEIIIVTSCVPNLQAAVCDGDVLTTDYKDPTDAEEEAISEGKLLLSKFVRIATELQSEKVKLPPHMRTKALLTWGAGNVGKFLVEFLDKVTPHVDIAVLGSRGMGAFLRSISGVVGVGSVSDYVVHHVKRCPGVLVLNPKHDDDDPAAMAHDHEPDSSAPGKQHPHST